MSIRAKKIRVEFNNSSEDFWEATCGSGIEFDEAIRMITRAWEEHDASAEPLIKDEKIRKAVRAWAEALGLQEVYCASNGYEIYGGIDDWVIQFDGEPFPFADKNKIYTIAELCGEEAPEPIEPTFVDLDERIKEKEK